MIKPFKTTLLDQRLREKQRENEKLRRQTLQRVLELLPQLAARYGFHRAYILGSLAKQGRFWKNSDIDIALEDLFRIVANHFENHITEPTAWHKELLSRMKMEIKGLRPRLVSDAAYKALDELRGFRHIFRHAYGVVLEPRKFKLVLQEALALKKVYKNDIANFLAQLKPTTKR